MTMLRLTPRKGIEMSETNDVKVGQVWRDNDKRIENRHIRVTGIDDGFARCTVLKIDGLEWVETGETKIRLDRFRPTSTGYLLEEES